MSRELWEKVTDGIGEKYINEASECFMKHRRTALAADEDEIGEQAVAIKIQPSDRKSGGVKALLAVVGAAAAVVLCILGGRYLLGGGSPVDPITSAPSGTSETSESAETSDVSPATSGLEQNIVLLPPYTDEGYVFDTNSVPFAAAIGLPEGWYMEGTAIYNADGNELAFIGYDAYEIYPEAVGQPNYYRAVYNQIMLGSVSTYDIDYTPVKSGSYYSSATCQHAVRDLETGETSYNQAILAYNDNVCSYIVINFTEEIDPQLLSDIAGSIELARDKVGASKLLASAFSEVWSKTEQPTAALPMMYAMEASLEPQRSLIAVFVPALYNRVFLFTMEEGLLKGCQMLDDVNTLEVYAGEEDFLLHVISEYPEEGGGITYQDSYYTYADHTLTETGSARRVESDGTVTSISGGMDYEQYIAWKIQQTIGYSYIRSAKFPENEDKLVPISDDLDVMAQHFLAALEDMPPNGGTYDDRDGIAQEEKDVQTLYATIAKRFFEGEYIPDRVGVFASDTDSAQMVGIYYERDGIQCCQLYYLRDNEMFFVGELTDLITLELLGDSLVTCRYTSLLEARYITDSYTEFVKVGGAYSAEEYDRAERLLDENGSVTMYFDCEANGSVKVTETAYKNERANLRRLAGESHFGIDFTAPYSTVEIVKNDIAALANQISLAYTEHKASGDVGYMPEEEEPEELPADEPQQSGLIYISTLPVDEKLAAFATEYFEGSILTSLLTWEQTEYAALGQGYYVRTAQSDYEYSPTCYFPIVGEDNEIIAKMRIFELGNGGYDILSIDSSDDYAFSINRLRLSTSPDDPADLVSGEYALYGVTSGDIEIIYTYRDALAIPDDEDAIPDELMQTYLLPEMEGILADRQGGKLGGDTVTTAINEPSPCSPYPAIARDFAESRVSSADYSVDLCRISDSEELVAVSYKNSEPSSYITATSHLYHIKDGVLTKLGRFDNMYKIAVYDGGLMLSRRYYEEAPDLELLCDSYAKFAEYNGTTGLKDIGITIQTLDESGNPTGYYTTAGVDIHSDFNEATADGLLEKQQQYSAALSDDGSYSSLIDFNNADKYKYLGSTDNADIMMNIKKLLTAPQ